MKNGTHESWLRKKENNKIWIKNLWWMCISNYHQINDYYNTLYLKFRREGHKKGSTKRICLTLWIIEKINKILPNAGRIESDIWVERRSYIEESTSQNIFSYWRSKYLLTNKRIYIDILYKMSRLWNIGANSLLDLWERDVTYCCYHREERKVLASYTSF